MEEQLRHLFLFLTFLVDGWDQALGHGFCMANLCFQSGHDTMYHPTGENVE